MSIGPELEQHFKKVTPTGSGWKALCPAHDDHDPSLSLYRGADGHLRVKCYAGCPSKKVLKAAGLSKHDLRRMPVHSSTRGGEGDSKPPRNGATAQHPVGLSLGRYAKAKKLLISFLKKLGLSTIFINRAKALKIPYFAEDGAETAVRFRVALEKRDGVDARFKWRRGSKPLPYGLWRLTKAKKAGEITLVEGESDAQTLWLHKIPALGIPGATTWKPDWAAYLDEIPVIYVVIEPDAGGQAILKWLSTVPFRDRVRIVDLGTYKDPSALHMAGPGKFLKRWRKVCKRSVPWADREKQESKARKRELWRECKHLATAPNILEKFEGALEGIGVVGEQRAAKLLYLVLTSRLLEHPVSSVVKGPSSAGKSFLTQSVLKFFPPEAFFALTAMSDHALAYFNEPMKHRVLVLYEAAGLKSEIINYLVRSLLSEGRIEYTTVMKVNGELRTHTLRLEGPTALLMTTARTRIHPELETRIFSIPTDDTRAQTMRIIKGIGSSAARNETDALGAEALSQWQAFQSWLQLKPHAVKVPFAKSLTKHVRPAGVRLRRDIPALLALVKAHALLHQKSRTRDADGAILATLKDYKAVYPLVADLVAEGVEVAVGKTVRNTVAVVRTLVDEGQGTALPKIAKHLKIDKSAASRRVKVAVEQGYLAKTELRQGYPLQLVLADPLPKEVGVLPSPKRLRKAWKRQKEASK